VKTFSIKKRINTELLIDGKLELYIQKGKWDQIKKITDLLERGELKWRECKQGSLFETTYTTWKERQTNGSLFGKDFELA